VARCGCSSECTCLLADGHCTFVSGTGAALSPYIVSLEISEEVGNQAVCTEDGLLVVEPTINHRATVLATGVIQTVLPAAADSVASKAWVSYDFVEDAQGLSVFLPGAGVAYTHSYIEVGNDAAGVYLIQASCPGWSGAPATPGDCILRLRLYKGNSDGDPGAGIGQVAQTRYSTNVVTPGDTPFLNVSRTITLMGGDCIYADFSATTYGYAFAGATLDTGPNYGSGVIPANSGLPFLQMTRLGAAGVVV